MWRVVITAVVIVTCSVAVNDLAAAANEYEGYPVSKGGGGGPGPEIPAYPEAVQLPEFGMPA